MWIPKASQLPCLCSIHPKTLLLSLDRAQVWVALTKKSCHVLGLGGFEAQWHLAGSIIGKAPKQSQVGRVKEHFPSLNLPYDHLQNKFLWDFIGITLFKWEQKDFAGSVFKKGRNEDESNTGIIRD